MSLTGMGSEEKRSAINNNNNYKSIWDVPAPRFIASFESKGRQINGTAHSVPRAVLPQVLSHALGRQLSISQMDSAFRHFDIGAPGEIGLQEFWERLQKFLTEKGEGNSAARSNPSSAGTKEGSDNGEPMDTRHVAMPSRKKYFPRMKTDVTTNEGICLNNYYKHF